PAMGMAFGLERVIELVKTVNPDFLQPTKPDVFLAQLGIEAAKHIFPLFEKLRVSGLRVAANFAKEGLKQQLEVANKMGVVYTVILGQ
ncbi:MAG: histidine--tRNA ligase, partial [Patescibacteria group bacterium]